MALGFEIRGGRGVVEVGREGKRASPPGRRLASRPRTRSAVTCVLLLPLSTAGPDAFLDHRSSKVEMHRSRCREMHFRFVLESAAVT